MIICMIQVQALRHLGHEMAVGSISDDSGRKTLIFLPYQSRQYRKSMVKGSVSRYFRPPFFSRFEPIQAPDKQAKIFSNWFSISLRYSNIKKLRHVHPTAESDSVVCIIPRSQTPRCDAHHGVIKTKHLKKLRGVHPTAESDSVVCIIPPESSSAVCIILRSQ